MSTTGNAESYIELRGSLSIPDAIHGKSAYEIAVAHGFDGTEEEWLLHLERAQSEAVEEAAEQAITDIANTKQTALTEIETAHTEITTDAAQALTDIAEAKATMLGEIEAVSNIVQTIGDSETAVMSQKAVTDIISTEYTDFTMIDGAFVHKANNGIVVTHSDYKYSDYIPVENVNYIYTNFGSNAGIAFYDENYKYVSGIGGDNELKWYKAIAPINAVYLRFSAKTTCTPACRFVSFPEQVARVNKKIPEIAQKINLAVDEQIEKNSIKNIVTTKNLLQYAKYVEGYSISSDGTMTASNNYSHYILTLPIGTYKVLRYSTCVNLTTGEQITNGSNAEGTFTLTAESKIGVNAYQGYLKKLFSTEYTENEVEELGEYTLGENVLTPKGQTETFSDFYASFSMFETLGVIGDSYASGCSNDGTTDGAPAHYPVSWPQMLGRRNGVEVTNYTKGGLSTRTWLTDADYGLAKLLADEPKNCYILALERNDYNHENAGNSGYIGTIADITSHTSYADYPDTFYGNYGKIIEQIKAHAPKALLVMMSGDYTNTLGTAYNAAVEEIAEHYGIPCMVQLDDPFFSSSYYQTYRHQSGGHPPVILYSGMALAIERMFQKAISEHAGDLLQFIGY